MPVSKVVSTAVLALFLGGSAGFAQVLGAAQPAEFPPASYKGRQYVDSKGCVYIRAGVGGNVTWVPRVTRARQPICGAKPTFAKATQNPEPAPKVVAAPEPAPQPKPVAKAQPAAKPAPKPKAPMKTVASVTKQPKPAKPARVIAAPKPKRAAPVKMAAPAASTGSCVQLGASGRYMQGSGLRCGPQAESPITYSDQPGSGKKAAARVAPRSATVPRTVVSAEPVRVPKGYRRVWTDDRLNPNRAKGTATGRAQMDLVWTQTVPRKLVDRATGRDVTRHHPNLVYPYTDLATQQREAAYKYIKTPKTAKKAKSVTQVAKPAPSTSGKQYVQVGTFGQPANAQRTAAMLKRSGLPVRMARYSKGARSYQIVMAGPFASANELQSALNTARRAGFRDAFLR